MLRLTPEQLSVATPEERALYHRALSLELALASPLDYAQHVSKRAQRYRHTVLLSNLIVRLVTGKLIHPTTGQPVRKMAVSMPPQHGKSYVISEHTPPWAITKWAAQGFRVGLAAYEADFAATWGKKARTHVQDHPEFGVLVDNSSRAANAWDLLPQESGGQIAGMNTAGVGGPFTGKGFHLVVIDDPIKNSVEAMSQTIRDSQWNWLGSTATSRSNSFEWVDPDTGEELVIGDAVLLVNTRWHEDEIQGRVLKEEPEEWYHLNLKAIADDNAPASDALGRQPGEPLCPERRSLEWLEKRRDNPSTGGYWWSALYQGEPNIEGGGIFKKASFRYHAPAPGHEMTNLELRDPSGATSYVEREKLSRFSILDPAATVKSYSDWSVLGTFDITPDRRLLLVDLVRQRLESADLKEWVYRHFLRVKPGYVGIGATTFGLTVITELRRMAVPVRPLPEKEDKISRAITAGSLLDGGRIFFPSGADWLDEFERELLAFPNGKHDDQVDVLAHAAREVAIGPWSAAHNEREPEDTSLEARIKRHIEKKHKRRHRRHPDLGRL